MKKITPLYPPLLKDGRGDYQIKNNNGITLIELIIVISVIGILVIALGFEFQGWMGKYRVENQIKQMYTDFMNARANAMSRNRLYFADFPSATSYRIREDTNEDSNPDSTLPTYPKTIEYTINWDGGALPTIIFNERGLMSLPGSIYLTSTVDADYDCLAITPTRINMGKWGNGTCTEK
jgi:prepilin-type N-terminal cleavage/methylation domain-containing protein